MRRRQPEKPTNTLQAPVELTDFRHEVWMSEQSTADWYRKHLGAVPRSPGISDFWQVRRSRAERDWALHNGIVLEHAPLRPDIRRLQELGCGRIRSLERAAIRSTERSVTYRQPPPG